MKHDTISLLFYISLFAGLPLGIASMVLWAKRIVKPMARGIDASGHVHLEAVAVKTTIFMIPGILGMGLFAIPCFYFGHLLKQENYCIEVIRFNSITRSHPDLKSRCSEFDLDELFKKAGKS